MKPEAISIAVVGGLGDEKGVSEVLRGVLGSVEGETSWVNKGGRVVTEQEGKAEDQVTKDVYVCVVILLLIGGVVFIRWRNRRGDSVDD